MINAAPSSSAPGVDAIGVALTGFQASQSGNSEVSIVENGGFEEGLQGWKVSNIFLSAGNGYPSISTSSFHSGSAAVALNFLSSTFGGSTAQSMELTGIFQTVGIRRLNGLRVQGWFSMRQTDAAVAARMRVQVGSLEVCYYVAYDTEQRLRKYDTASSRSILVNQVGPGQIGWVELDRDVAQDFGSLFGSEGQASFQRDQTTVTVELDLIGFGYISNYQVMLWDDVQAIATVPVNSTVTTTALIPPTTTSFTQSTTTTPTSSYTRAASSTVSERVFAGTMPLVQGTVAVGVALTLVAGFFLARRGMRKRRPAGPKCTFCGAVDPRTDSIYCSQCGKELDLLSREKDKASLPEEPQ